ncbi:WD40-repeat-containing domain protein [Podospora didyma]|uniref:WD40-repeat-containing domain protein n=1 Tax=Podospora didyma TaxID=330526 RepID=A0AAE0U4Q8_9PEZI|nr:WD40-repeat-containing domain protein [Podospora didyma]
MSSYLSEPPTADEKSSFDLIVKHGHQDLVQAVAFNSYGDRCATGSVDGKIRVFNRHKDGIWRHCDNWGAHGGEILELQWLPPTIYPNLLASLGIEGRFKLWAEDPSAAPGRRFSNATRSSSSSRGGGGGGSENPKAAFETRNSRSPYRSFSMKHFEDTRHTYLALLSADGRVTVYENEQPENLADYTQMDEFSVCPRPARGEETAFRVRFDPNPDVCYTALRAGIPTDALGLVVASMDSVKIYRTRDTVSSSMGVTTAAKEFYLAAEISGHRGLVRDIAWAPGNIRGYDIIATACQDGFVRVFSLTTPTATDKGWTSSSVRKHSRQIVDEDTDPRDGAASTSELLLATSHPKSGIRAGLDQSRTSTERRTSGLPGQVKHVAAEIAKLDSHRTPVWRVGFDDDGQIMGSVGDEGKLMCYRQTPDGTWAKSSELSMVKMRMVAP